MDTNMTPRKLLGQSRNIVGIWTKNPKMFMHGTSLPKYLRLSKRLKTSVDQLAELQAQVRSKMQERDGLAEELNEFSIRFRALASVVFGTGSIEYELVGGTPKRKRKKPGPKGSRKPKVVEGSGVHEKKFIAYPLPEKTFTGAEAQAS